MNKNSKQMNLMPNILQITGVMYENVQWIHRSEGKLSWCRLKCENTLNSEQSLKHMYSAVKMVISPACLATSTITLKVC